jgi:hypothetical protein
MGSEFERQWTLPKVAHPRTDIRQCTLYGICHLSFQWGGDVLGDERTCNPLRKHSNAYGSRNSGLGCEPDCQRQLRRSDSVYQFHGVP